MKSLEELRAEIDQLDQQLVALIEQRVSIAKQIQQLKKSTGLPTVDLQREQEVLKKLSEQNPLVPAELIQQIYLTLFEFSKNN